MSSDVYQVYAVRYAHRETTTAEVFYGDTEDEPIGMDYFVWAITNGDRTVVVDLGFTEAIGTRRGRQFLRTPDAGLAQIGIDCAAVEDVIITHFHYDHTLGNQEWLKAYPGVEIVAHKATRDAITEGGNNSAIEFAKSDLEARIAGGEATIARVAAEGGPGVDRVLEQLRQYFHQDIFVRQDAYREAVIETLQWAEKNAAETRLVGNGKVRTVPTGNLTVALFQHDTNRNQEPNLHFHAVIANVTKGADGKWRTLKNDRLWSLNTLLNSMTMARFRLSVEKLGYAVGPVGKHGNFEAAGFRRDIRPAELLDRGDL